MDLAFTVRREVKVSSAMQNLIQIELNEVNFEFVLKYARDGYLPNLKRLIERHGLIETSSETQYAHLEPWIQWVTAHTGLEFSEHGVFRLGDIGNRLDLLQIWEALERKGLKVGAVSPMNAANRCSAPSFFIPDPWTKTIAHAGPLDQRLYTAISAAANENAEGHRLNFQQNLDLLAGLGRHARVGSLLDYVSLIFGSLTQKWRRAGVLDRLLSDLFISLVRANRPNYSTLFLNAAAHIQHHYMFNAAPYDGAIKNPSWYIAEKLDPLLEIYQLYDKIVKEILDIFPDHRILIATGLHQDPYPEELFYWRLIDHAAFLREVGVEYERVEPRMSRDFVVFFKDGEGADLGAQKLSSLHADDGRALFEVDNRGASLFVELCYPSNIKSTEGFSDGVRRWSGLREWVAFVALKNGKHNGVGYLIDTGQTNNKLKAERISLAELYRIPFDHFGLEDEWLSTNRSETIRGSI